MSEPRDDVQVSIALGSTSGTVVHDSDIALMTESEFEEFWATVGAVVRTMAKLRKAARERKERAELTPTGHGCVGYCAICAETRDRLTILPASDAMSRLEAMG